MSNDVKFFETPCINMIDCDSFSHCHVMDIFFVIHAVAIELMFKPVILNLFLVATHF